MILVVILAAGGIQSLATFSEKSWVTRTVSIVVMMLFAFTMVRFGWLAAFVGLFVSSILNVMPLTFTPHAWYASATLLAVAVFVALALYGSFVALGRRQLFSAEA